MTLRHMKIFCAVCDNDYNTTKAATYLNMTQPAVSLAIKEMESYYDIILFNRVGRRLSITPVGCQLLNYARHILSLFDDIEKEVKDWDNYGKMRIGASITIGSQFLPQYVRDFKKRYPEIDIEVFVAPKNLLEEKLINYELDFALIEGLINNSMLISTAYMDDYLTVVCPESSGFVQGQTITLEEFGSHKLLLRNKGSGTRETFDIACTKLGFTPTVRWESTSTAALINAAINGLGLAVVPYHMIASPLTNGVIITVNVEGLDLTRKFYITMHKDKYLHSSAKAFINMCKNSETDLTSENYVPIK